MIAGIVLAAGMSTRMGTSKQLLPLGDRTVIEVVAGVVLSRLERVVVVLGYRAEGVGKALERLPVECVINPDYGSGMLSSVKSGIRAVFRAKGYLVCLGDQPGVDPQIIDAVLAAYSRSGKGIVIPTYGGRRGHPILISRTYRREILSLPEDLGLNVVTRGHPDDTLEVPVADPQILRDMDTPADYQRELARLKNRTR